MITTKVMLSMIFGKIGVIIYVKKILRISVSSSLERPKIDMFYFWNFQMIFLLPLALFFVFFLVLIFYLLSLLFVFFFIFFLIFSLILLSLLLLLLDLHLLTVFFKDTLFRSKFSWKKNDEKNFKSNFLYFLLKFVWNHWNRSYSCDFDRLKFV